jgi:hypothetical protein
VYRSERKAFCQKERQRIQNLNEGVTQDSHSASSGTQPGISVTADATPLRLPHESSQALRLLDPSMGLGRGRNSHMKENATPGQSSLEGNFGLGLGRGTFFKVELPNPVVTGRGKPL